MLGRPKPAACESSDGYGLLSTKGPKVRMGISRIFLDVEAILSLSLKLVYCRYLGAWDLGCVASQILGLPIFNKH